MVISRSDAKRRRKEGDGLEDSLQGSPKRTKVHAQRKFAQGSSNLSSPALTPVKDKDKVKSNGTVLSPELIPSKRPKTEDFLTFLCFRGTPILPPQLDFFNVASVQDNQDEEQGSSQGDCSNSRMASVASASHKPQRSASAEQATTSGVAKRSEKIESDTKKKPPTAVQAIRKKYQEQRLAKQRATTLTKLAQKVKGKNMVRTRSSTHSEESRPLIIQKLKTKKHIIKKSSGKVLQVTKKLRSLKYMPLRRMSARGQRKGRDLRHHPIRRGGLRSGGQLPPGSEDGLKSEKGQHLRLAIRAKKVVSDKCKAKVFVSSLSDFSSDDDQPLVKRTRPLEHSNKQQLARKVIKRIVKRSLKLRPHMITRSKQQQPTPAVATAVGATTRVSSRPTRKTKEAAALYMELLGKKLINPDAEADEDSLSIDSFPELPNSRRNEQRENEMKARLSKEKNDLKLQRKEGQHLKKDVKKDVQAQKKDSTPLKKGSQIQKDGSKKEFPAKSKLERQGAGRGQESEENKGRIIKSKKTDKNEENKGRKVEETVKTEDIKGRIIRTKDAGKTEDIKGRVVKAKETDKNDEVKGRVVISKETDIKSEEIKVRVTKIKVTDKMEEIKGRVTKSKDTDRIEKVKGRVIKSKESDKTEEVKGRVIKSKESDKTEEVKGRVIKSKETEIKAEEVKVKVTKLKDIEKTEESKGRGVKSKETESTEEVKGRVTKGKETDKTEEVRGKVRKSKETDKTEDIKGKVIKIKSKESDKTEETKGRVVKSKETEKTEDIKGKDIKSKESDKIEETKGRVVKSRETDKTEDIKGKDINYKERDKTEDTKCRVVKSKETDRTEDIKGKMVKSKESDKTEETKGRVIKSKETDRTEDIKGKMVKSKESDKTEETKGRVLKSKESGKIEETNGRVVKSKESGKTEEVKGRVMKSKDTKKAEEVRVLKDKEANKTEEVKEKIIKAKETDKTEEGRRRAIKSKEIDRPEEIKGRVFKAKETDKTEAIKGRNTKFKEIDKIEESKGKVIKAKETDISKSGSGNVKKYDSVGKDGVVGKEKSSDDVGAIKCSKKVKKYDMQRIEDEKGKQKEAVVTKTNKKDPNVYESNTNKSRGPETGHSLRNKKNPSVKKKSLDSEDENWGEDEDEDEPMKPPCAPRRSLRRGSRDTSQQFSDSLDSLLAEGTTTRSSSRRSSCTSLSPTGRQVLKSSRGNADSSEDKYSDSDEEPLGKIALKNNSGYQKVSENVKEEKICRKGQAGTVKKQQLKESSDLISEDAVTIQGKDIKSKIVKKSLRAVVNPLGNVAINLEEKEVKPAPIEIVKKVVKQKQIKDLHTSDSDEHKNPSQGNSKIELNISNEVNVLDSKGNSEDPRPHQSKEESEKSSDDLKEMSFLGSVGVDSSLNPSNSDEIFEEEEQETVPPTKAKSAIKKVIKEEKCIQYESNEGRQATVPSFISKHIDQTAESSIASKSNTIDSEAEYSGKTTFHNTESNLTSIASLENSSFLENEKKSNCELPVSTSNEEKASNKLIVQAENEKKSTNTLSSSSEREKKPTNKLSSSDNAKMSTKSSAVNSLICKYKNESLESNVVSDSSISEIKLRNLDKIISFDNKTNIEVSSEISLSPKNETKFGHDLSPIKDSDTKLVQKLNKSSTSKPEGIDSDLIYKTPESKKLINVESIDQKDISLIHKFPLKKCGAGMESEFKKSSHSSYFQKRWGGISKKTEGQRRPSMACPKETELELQRRLSMVCLKEADVESSTESVSQEGMKQRVASPTQGKPKEERKLDLTASNVTYQGESGVEKHKRLIQKARDELEQRILNSKRHEEELSKSSALKIQKQQDVEKLGEAHRSPVKHSKLPESCSRLNPEIYMEPETTVHTKLNTWEVNNTDIASVTLQNPGSVVEKCVVTRKEVETERRLNPAAPKEPQVTLKPTLFNEYDSRIPSTACSEPTESSFTMSNIMSELVAQGRVGVQESDMLMQKQLLNPVPAVEAQCRFHNDPEIQMQGSCVQIVPSQKSYDEQVEVLVRPEIARVFQDDRTGERLCLHSYKESEIQIGLERTQNFMTTSATEVSYQRQSSTMGVDETVRRLDMVPPPLIKQRTDLTNTVPSTELGALGDPKGKGRVNERIEKWLSESCSGSLVHKKDCSMIEGNSCKCGIAVSDEDMLLSEFSTDKLASESISASSELEEGNLKLAKVGYPLFLSEVTGEQTYKPETISALRLDDFKQTLIQKSVKPENKMYIEQTNVNITQPADSTISNMILSNEVQKTSNLNFVLSSLAQESINLPMSELCPKNMQWQNTQLHAAKNSTSSQDVLAIPIEQQHTLVSTANATVTTDIPISKDQAVYTDREQQLEQCQALASVSNQEIVKSQFYNNEHSFTEELPEKEKTTAPIIENETKKVIEVNKIETSFNARIGMKPVQVSDRSAEKKSIFQQRRSFLHKAKERKDLTPSANAFSPENESSVYAFETEPESPPISTPFRRRARDSRTSSTTTSKSEEDLAKLGEEEVSPPAVVSLPPPVTVQIVQAEKPVMCVALQSSPSYRYPQTCASTQAVAAQVPSSRTSTSIAVQVNLDTEPCLDTSQQCPPVPEAPPPEPVPQRSMECSTQTEVTEEDDDESEGHLFYIPLQQAPTPSQQLIQGVAVKLGTEGPTGPNQRVIMRAKLVTKAPNFNRASASTQDGALGLRRSVLGHQHQRPTSMLMMEQKPPYCSTVGTSSSSSSSGTYPPVGTVQPTTRSRPNPANFNRSKSDAMTGTSECDIKTVVSTNTVLKHPGGLIAAKSSTIKLHQKLHQKQGTAVKDKRVSAERDLPAPSTSSFSAVITPTKLPSSKSGAKERRSSFDQTSPGTSGKGNTGTKRGLQKGKMSRASEANYVCAPSNVTTFPSLDSPSQLVEAPTFHPTEKEFQDPLEFIDKIRPVAEKFGLCRVVPPSNFKPECKVTDDMRFTAYNQYVHKMLQRWGPNVKEMMAIRKYLATQGIPFTHPPWIGGMEVDLPRLYQTVQSFGGLKEVIEKKRWQRVADGMKIPKSAQDRVTKLDDIYCKYLLPYDTLSPGERQMLFDEVETGWALRESRISSQNSGTNSESPEDESDGDTTDESEECIVKTTCHIRRQKKTSFNDRWLLDDTLSSWLKPLPEEPYSGSCTVCKTSFSLSNMVRQALISHMAGKKLVSAVRCRLQPTTLKTFFNASPSPKLSVVASVHPAESHASEIIEATNTGTHNGKDVYRRRRQLTVIANIK